MLIACQELLNRHINISIEQQQKIANKKRNRKCGLEMAVSYCSVEIFQDIKQGQREKLALTVYSRKPWTKG